MKGEGGQKRGSFVSFSHSLSTNELLLLSAVFAVGGDSYVVNGGGGGGGGGRVGPLPEARRSLRMRGAPPDCQLSFFHYSESLLLLLLLLLQKE